MPRSQAEVAQEFQDQMAALQASCESFDMGVTWEAKRIASAVAILFHDPIQRGKKPPKGSSLATQLGIKSQMKLISTGVPDSPGNLLSWHPLVSLRMGNRTRPDGSVEHVAKYVAKNSRGGDGPPMQASVVSYTTWWDEVVLIDRVQGGGGRMSRKGLIMSMRNQDGGAHYDPELSDETYARFASGVAPGWQHVVVDAAGNETASPMLGAHLATCRQIGWEVVESVRQAGVL